MALAELKVQIIYDTPRNGMYYIVKNDYDMVWADFENVTHVSRPTRNGVPYNRYDPRVNSNRALPATARFMAETYVNFDCDLQWWEHGLCMERSGLSHAESKDDFASMNRGNAFRTDFAGSNTRHDCVNSTNEDKDYIKIKPMAMGGTVLRWVADSGNNIIFEAINPLMPYLQYHPTRDWWLFFYPTISAREWEYVGKDEIIKREYFQEPMHYYNERAVLPMYGFRKDNRSSTGYSNMISKSRVRKIGASEPIPNPYIMRYGRKIKNPYMEF